MDVAIVIGVDKYQASGFDDLPACKNDAKVFKDVIESVRGFEEILFIGNNEPALEIKRKISDLVDSYKGRDVNELMFYFSGHGERVDDDFYYIPSDFNLTRKESTGLRNTEIDDWVKAISPKLYVKIVDACFSGTQYIKSEISDEAQLKKSVNKRGLNDIYFLFSSRENQVSYAGAEFSKFTESILTAISEQKGDVRYRDIMAAVADDLARNGGAQPIFLTQSNNTEKLGFVSGLTHKIIFDAFGLPFNEDGEIDEIKSETGRSVAAQESVFELAKKASIKSCFDEANLKKFIDDFNLEIQSWPENVAEIYEINVDKDMHPAAVPNSSKIGEWLSEKNDSEYFAEPTYGKKEYEIEEYKALPKRPVKRDRWGLGALDIVSSLGLSLNNDNDVEYRLEKIKKTSSFVNGFQYTHYGCDAVVKVAFSPLIEIVPPVCIHMVALYSNKEMSIHFAFEALKRRSWDDVSKPSCKRWKTININVNDVGSSKHAAGYIKVDVLNWLEIEIKRRLD